MFEYAIDIYGVGTVPTRISVRHIRRHIGHCIWQNRLLRQTDDSLIKTVYCSQTTVRKKARDIVASATVDWGMLDVVQFQTGMTAHHL